MSHHDDRSPLLLKVALRQSSRRIQAEAENLSQYEALAGNLGWEEVADKVSAAKAALVEASERSADAVEEAVRVQADAAEAHQHAHEHSHTHTHDHPHEHQHHQEESE
jgi:hypothetical protein